MGTRIVLLVVGLAVGVGIGYVVKGAGQPEKAPDQDVASLDARINELEQADAAKASMITDLQEQLATEQTARADAEGQVTELEARLAAGTPGDATPGIAEPDKPTGTATYADLQKAAGKLGQNFRAHMLGKDEELAAEIQELFAKASAEDVAKLIEAYGEVSDIGSKTVMAHLLGMSHRPEALQALEDIVRDKNQTMVERRLASHGLAFSGAESVKPLLREMAKEDPDRGTRANSAFGLYRMNDPEGVNLYFKATDEAFAEGDPLAANYLGGLALMDDRALPAVRERVAKYENWQAKIQLIMFIQGRKDKGSLNLLTEISRDETQKAEVRAAAESAIKTIEGEK